ncbi:MAG: PucR family transcriptional regulator [Clostridiales bacterium]|nr:PucR family transcriptional regulator [Clostridiales bacterium]
MERFIEKVHKSKEPIFVHPSIHKYTLLMSNIILEEKILGHMAVLEYERPFEESDIDLLKQLTEIVSSELLKNKVFRNSKGLAFENFITDLLYGKIKDPRFIEERIKSLGWELQDCQYLMLIKAEQENLENTPFPNFREMLESLVPYSKSVIYFDHLLLIVSRKKEKMPLTGDSLSELSVFLRNNQLKCGISRPFEHLEDIRKHYEQSLKSIDLGTNIKREDVIYIYDDYVVYHVLDACKEKLDLVDICCPVVMDLIEYDRKNKTHYTLTLYTYLTQALNLTVSAEMLFIHHNTMRFRIEKIQKILNLDLNNGNILFHLLLSFKALEFAGQEIFF